MINEELTFDMSDDFYGTVEQIDSFCERCKQGLKDPVCIACYNHELIPWLRENISNKEVIHYILRRIGHTFPLVDMNHDHCIFCKRGMVVICRNCFTSEVSRILQELNLDTSIRNFLHVFNYQSDVINQT